MLGAQVLGGVHVRSGPVSMELATEGKLQFAVGLITEALGTLRPLGPNLVCARMYSLCGEQILVS